VSGAAFGLVLPEALFEFALGVWLTVKGFRPSPITAAGYGLPTEEGLTA